MDLSVELFRQISAHRQALPGSPVTLTLTGLEGVGSAKGAVILPAVAAHVPSLHRLHIHGGATMHLLECIKGIWHCCHSTLPVL